VQQRIDATKPSDVVDAVRAGRPLAVEGSGSKRGYGRPVQADAVLSTKGISGIRLYQPDELVLTAWAGTPLDEIVAALAEKHQHLAFEPPLSSALLGGGTIGGIIAANLSGPRRPTAGAARDHFLGFTAVNGLGEEFKGGGKVVKNVTGYDLPKLMAGSMGTLAVLTEVTLKVLPAPEKQRTVLVPVGDLDGAYKCLHDALHSAFEVDGAALLPADAAARSEVDMVRAPGCMLAALRLTGSPVSVADRCAALRASIEGPSEELHSARSRILWGEIANVAPLLPQPANVVLRASVMPDYGTTVIGEMGLDSGWLMDWGGARIWIARPDASDEGKLGFIAYDDGGGDVAMVRAPDNVRSDPDYDPLPSDAPEPLTRRVKAAFDPHGILNPGRMFPGI